MPGANGMPTDLARTQMADFGSGLDGFGFEPKPGISDDY